MAIILMILKVLGSVALFLYGMKVMSDSMQKTAGTELQNFLNRTTQTSLSGLVSGTLFTGALQSSSVVSLITLSFVNAGLLNLKRAFSIILGANVGTTLKLWLIVGVGFFLPIENLVLPILAISILVYFLGKSVYREWAHFAIGLALVFMGFYFLQHLFPDFSQNPILQQYIEKFSGNSGWGISFLFIGIGFLITLLFHSSSAFVWLTAILVSKGLNLEQGAMMVIGANLGATSAALIASLIGNRATKIVAWFHFYFNLFAGILAVFLSSILLFYLQKIFVDDSEFVLVGFHTIINLFPAILILPIMGKLALWAEEKLGVKSDKDFELKVIGKLLHSNMYLYEANREILKFAGIIRQIIHHLGRMISESDEEKLKELNVRILQLEQEADELEENLLDYLHSIYTFEMTGEVAFKIHRLTDVCRHLENTSDLATRVAAIHVERRKNNSYITPKLRELLLELQESLSLATTHLIQNLNETGEEVDLKQAKRLEKSIDKKYGKAEDALLKAIESDKVTARSALYYTELIQAYELMGDHLYQATKLWGK